MKPEDLRAYLARIERRKAERGLTDTEARTDALRNRGANRTPEKRELLRRARERVQGKPTRIAYF
jgi:hypothetical protein